MIEWFVNKKKEAPKAKTHTALKAKKAPYDPNSKAVKKGKIGEEIVDLYLRQYGIEYMIPKKGEHKVDRYVTQPNGISYYLEIKTKEPYQYKGIKWTGFDDSNFQVYKALYEQTGLDTLVLFVDYKEAKIYGGFLIDTLEKHGSPWITRKDEIRCYNRECMTVYEDLNSILFKDKLEMLYELTDCKKAKDGQVK
jgi:hypothetical protein